MVTYYSLTVAVMIFFCCCYLVSWTKSDYLFYWRNLHHSSLGNLCTEVLWGLCGIWCHSHISPQRLWLCGDGSFETHISALKMTGLRSDHWSLHVFVVNKKNIFLSVYFLIPKESFYSNKLWNRINIHLFWWISFLLTDCATLDLKTRNPEQI